MLAGALKERERELSRLKCTLAKRDAQIAAQHEALTRIMQSRSWRLMAPLRVAGRVARASKSALRYVRELHQTEGGLVPMLRRLRSYWQAYGAAGVIAQVQAVLGLAPEPRVKSSTSRELESADPKSHAGLQGLRSDPTQTNPSTILFVSHEASLTGAPILLLEVARLIKQELGVRCIFLLRRGGELRPEFSKLGPTVLLDEPDTIDAQMLAVLQRQNIQLVFSNTATNGLVQRSLKRLGCPVLCHMHELGHSIKRHFGGENIKAVLNTTDMFLAGSAAVARYLLEDLRLSNHRVVVAHPFIKVAENRLAAQRNAAVRLPADGILVGACGTVGWRKGTDLFIQLAHHVKRLSDKKIYFVWIGGPTTNAEFVQLQHDAVQLGVQDRLIFPGTQKDHIPYFARFDIFVLPSREDPFPLVALDAASLGIPVLCFDKAGGTPELVENDAGRVVPYMDIPAMASAVCELANDSACRHRLGNTAAKKVESRYDVDAAGRHIVSIVRTQIHTSRSVDS